MSQFTNTATGCDHGVPSPAAAVPFQNNKPPRLAVCGAALAGRGAVCDPHVGRGGPVQRDGTARHLPWGTEWEREGSARRRGGEQRRPSAAGSLIGVQAPSGTEDLTKSALIKPVPTCRFCSVFASF